MVQLALLRCCFVFGEADYRGEVVVVFIISLACRRGSELAQQRPIPGSGLSPSL
jgi:hypothetical protein